MRAVTDTGPLIHLSWIDRLEMLGELFQQVLVPPAVRQELLQGGTQHLGARSLRNALSSAWLNSRDVTDRATVLELRISLGAGEAEAIALATESAPHLLLIDDRRARLEAVRRGLAISGTIGLLRMARDSGLIPAAYPAVRQLQASGFWVSADLVEHLRREES